WDQSEDAKLDRALCCRGQRHFHLGANGTPIEDRTFDEPQEVGLARQNDERSFLPPWVVSRRVGLVDRAALGKEKNSPGPDQGRRSHERDCEMTPPHRALVTSLTRIGRSFR